MQISGSSAVVVGGTGGLGEATVRRLHGAGAKVVIADVADDKGKALASELGVNFVHTDATSTDDINAALAEAESLGPLRIAVDCHGGPAAGGRLVGKDGSALDLEGFEKTITFYLTAVFNVVRLCAAAIATPGAARHRRPGRDRRHRVDRGLRRPDRSDLLRGRKGWRHRHDPGGRARSLSARESASSPSRPA